ncbi:hypothetical protein FOMPIDRAFT_115441 [Fomitopsis schrenkii]|uniref:BTB domain-containing protein n=1 Tax=Fomitopsis schrenkii TaxID=2126942 RepID=S8E677_FOMSC|nr:hypothetical protein FOMPIDRAFT_115441 [Fomitopsis schrenkii]
MRAAFSRVSANYDITLHFVVEDVREFFEPDDPTEDSLVDIQQLRKLRTETFGPNLYIECKSESTADGEPCMSCHLFAGTTPYPGPITWSICGASLRGDYQYFQYSLTHTFVPGVGIGWRETLSKVTHWDQSDILREENALRISVTVRAREGPRLYPDNSLVQHRIPELFSGSDELQGYIRSLESDDCSDYEDDDTEDPTTSHQAGSLRNEHDSPEAQESDSEKAGDDQATADLEYESESAPTSTSALPDDWQWSFDESKSLDEAPQLDAHGVVSEDNCPRGPPDTLELDPTITMRTITVVGVASPTWEAFLFYLYTNEVVFAPLTSKSEVARRVFIAHHKAKYPRQPAPCSPKSMYRLAHLLAMKELKALSLKYLASQISKENVITEIFTKFTSQYEEVQNVELQVLREHWEELKQTEQLLEVSARIVRGELPHVTGILAALVPLVQLSA